MPTQFLRLFSFLLAVLFFLTPAVSLADPSQRLVQMLDYIGVDYPPTVVNSEVVNEVEYAEMQEFSGMLGAMIQAMPEAADKSALFEVAIQIHGGIQQRIEGEQVAMLAQQLKEDLIATYQISVGPKKAPNLSGVQALYESECSSCHGVLGYGDGPIASVQEIPPSDFHDMTRQYTRSIFDLYNTISLGVDGTPMKAFNQLSDEQRWALAISVSRFSGKHEQRETGKLLWQKGYLRDYFKSLSNLTGMSYAKAEELGDDANVDGKAILAYLRSEPSILDVSDHAALDNSIAMLAVSLEHARAGDHKAAYKAALSAYLDGFELAEPSLVIIDKPLKLKVEKEMIAFREFSKSGNVEQLERVQVGLVDLLNESKNVIGSTQMSPAGAFTGSFIILLREGVEAILVLAAIMTALIKTGRREAMKYIHAGWVSAVVLGVVTWWVAENVISVSGASREVTEGAAALFAALILIYVGFWLHSASNSKQWKKFIEHKIDNAMENSTLWVLATVSFVAVYREMFETVLFYQAMWIQIDSGDSQQGFLLGVLAALALLLVLAFLVMRVGTRLPIKQFFQINAVLLFLLAVVFTGQGIAAFQEAGVIASSMIEFPRVEMLGIYPTIQSLGLQLFVLLLGAGLLSYQRKKS
ncbi:MAG: FTR1 family protein [Gammaproteobacteria bacterium]|nr:FTR1 family protein [Gammaproteobacteria bacterium]MCK5262235.1 FTR1 family protein [Gammaproteobacteria bacterium]